MQNKLADIIWSQLQEKMYTRRIDDLAKNLSKCKWQFYPTDFKELGFFVVAVFLFS